MLCILTIVSDVINHRREKCSDSGCIVTTEQIGFVDRSDEWGELAGEEESRVTLKILI